MEKLRNLSFITFILVLMVGCKSTKNTFDTVYEKKVGAKPNYFISFEEDGTGVFGVEAKKSKDKFIANKAFYVSGDGQTVWTKKITRLGEIKKDPNFKIVWDEGVALFFSRSLFKFNLSCVDLQSQKELWSKEESNPGKYTYSAAYIPTENGLLHYTPNGLEMYDIRTGKTKWTRPDLTEKINFSDYITGNNNSGYYFSPDLNKILISKDNELYSIDPETGDYEWKIEKPIGTVFNADIFDTDGVAFFYGIEDKSLAEAIIRSSDERVDQIMNVVESGLVKKDIYFVDLEKGEIVWENKYQTNGNESHFLLDDKVIVSNIVTYAFNRETGDIVWQSVDEDKLKDQAILKAIKALDIFDLTVGERQKPTDVLVDDEIYNIYPVLFDNPIRRNRIILKKMNVHTGETVWQTPEEKIVPSYFYQFGDKVYLVGGNLIPTSKLFVYDKTNGKKLYDVNLVEYIRDIVPTGELLYITYGTNRSQMKVLDINTGEEKEITMTYGHPSTIRDVGNYIMAAYDHSNFKKEDKIAFHKKKNFEVVKELDVPEYFNNFTYEGGNLFLTNFNGRERGVIDIDLENLTVHDYLITRTSGSFTMNGQDQIMGTYHLFISSDGKHVFETDGKKIRKLAIH